MAFFGKSSSPTVSDPSPYRRQFVQATGLNDYSGKPELDKHLTIREADYLWDYLRFFCFGVDELEIQLLKDYTDHVIYKGTVGYSMLTSKSPRRTRFEYRLDLKDPRVSYTNREKIHIKGIPYATGTAPPIDTQMAVGATLMHERLHWEGVADSNDTPTREGPAYGLEYYLVRRGGRSGREKQIIDVGEWAEGPIGHYLFCLWAFHMKWAFDVAEGKLAGTSFTREEGRDCVMKFVTDGAPYTWMGSGHRETAHKWAMDQINQKFGPWSEGDPLPGTRLTPADGARYIAECRVKIGAVMSAAIP